MNPFNLDVPALEKKARAVRRHIVTMNSESPAGGHTGADLSEVEVLTALYFRILDTGPDRLADPDRDVHIQSKGHGVGGLYCVLAEAGYFPTDWLRTYQQNDSRLPGHPVRQKTPGVELNTGALGHGLPVAVGVALAAKRDGSPRTVYAFTGDGELAEGSNWEAALVAAHYKLDNLVIINDKNRMQLAGYTTDIMNTDPLADKWRAFGLDVVECDGNDMASVVATLEGLERKGRPNVVISNSMKGHGISFIQGRPEWHHRVPKGEEIARALGELDHD